MTEDEFWYLISRLFVVEQNPKLEKKVWFRLLKVAQGFLIFLVVIVALFTAYLTFDSKSLSNATLVCNDGTTWSAMDPDYQTLELDTNQKCGLCNKRNNDNTYNHCSYDDSYQMRYNSYEVERQYTKDNSFIAVILYTVGVLFGGLIIVKILAKLIVYILGGGNKED
jgi:hypothetical protein